MLLNQLQRFEVVRVKLRLKDPQQRLVLCIFLCSVDLFDLPHQTNLLCHDLVLSQNRNILALNALVLLEGPLLVSPSSGLRY